MAGTNVVSGLASGLDWRKIIDQLRALEDKKIETVQSHQTTEKNRLSAWQSINTKLLSLRTAAGKLKETTDFNLFTTSLASSNTTTDAENVLSATTNTSAATGTYKIVVTSLAAAQKLSSGSYASQTTALGLSGDIIVGGRVVKIASTDTLSSLRNKINGVNTGTNPSQVTASIVNYGNEGYRLILTSNAEGAEGISLSNGGSTDLLGTLGLVDSADKTAKNALTGGNRSDLFTAADKAIGGADLLNLTTPQSGSVSLTIDGTARSVSINLGTDSLNSIRDSINTAFGSTVASVLTETDDAGNTEYRLLIEGSTIAYTDSNNILETLGILKRAGASDEKGMTGDVANNSGGVAITSSTLVKDIDGYTSYASGDTITLSGTSTSGGAVNSAFSITDATTVQDLLTEIQNRFGSVTASLTADGRIRVVDNEIGDTHLAVNLTPSKATLKLDGDGNLGAISTIRKRQIQAGANANISVDGVAVTPSSNMVSDVISGVTLNLKEAAPDTTVTLNVGRDYEGVKEEISGFVTAYNDLLEAINGQLTYDAASKKPGGPLFGDGTLRGIKSSLNKALLTKVSGVNENFSTIGMIGISLDKNAKLSIDAEKLQGYLETNFEDVQKLFAMDWSSTNSNLTYLSHSTGTKEGTYNIQITGVSPVGGYFVNSGDASGTGETLTGLSGDARGLVARYSGTATGSVGSMTLTFGIGELLDRQVYSVADPTYGFISDKEDTIQNTISNYDKQIAKMQDRIDRKMQDMEARFIMMETTLSKLQSMSSWITGQINALSK
jgi:flagellar hook-associated protein 2